MRGSDPGSDHLRFIRFLSELAFDVTLKGGEMICFWLREVNRPRRAAWVLEGRPGGKLGARPNEALPARGAGATS
jgi:hypothetical protein